MPTEPSHPIIAKRGYICIACGFVRRHYDPRSAGWEFGGDRWPCHCDKPMRLMGHRQAAAAALLSEDERLEWIKLGARVMKGRGRRKWRAILSEKLLERAYPLT